MTPAAESEQAAVAAQDRAMFDEWCELVWGDAVGWAVITEPPPFPPRRGPWQDCWRWPAQRPNLRAQVLLAGQARDVVAGVFLHSGRNRRAVTALPGRYLWADLDHDLTDAQRAFVEKIVARPGSFTVRCGSRWQLYLRLTGWRPPEEIKAWNTVLKVAGRRPPRRRPVPRVPSARNEGLQRRRAEERRPAAGAVPAVAVTVVTFQGPRVVPHRPGRDPRRPTRRLESSLVTSAVARWCAGATADAVRRRLTGSTSPTPLHKIARLAPVVEGLAARRSAGPARTLRAFPGSQDRAAGVDQPR